MHQLENLHKQQAHPFLNASKFIIDRNKRINITMAAYFSVLIHTWKGGRGEELTREKVRGAMLHKAGPKYQLD
jgi:hypothetical protein